MNILRLPDTGASTGEAEVLVWLKQVGDPVAAGEPLLEVQSDKANVEVEADASGTLVRILAEEGQLVKAGDLLAVIAEPGDALDAPAIDEVLARADATDR